MYQANSERTGKVVIIPSSSTPSTTVTLNDNIMVKRKYVKSVTINNVPEGEAKINYVSDNSSYKEMLNQEMSVNVISGKETTKLVQVPPRSNGYWVYSGVGLAALLVILFVW